MENYLFLVSIISDHIDMPNYRRHNVTRILVCMESDILRNTISSSVVIPTTVKPELKLAIKHYGIAFPYSWRYVKEICVFIPRCSVNIST